MLGRHFDVKFGLVWQYQTLANILKRLEAAGDECLGRFGLAQMRLPVEAANPPSFNLDNSKLGSTGQ